MSAVPPATASATELAGVVTHASRRAVAAAFAAVLVLLCLLLVERSLFLRLEGQAHDRAAEAADVAHRIELLDEQTTLAAHLIVHGDAPVWRLRYDE
jgi:ADP-ribosylglycohydrolase